MVIELFECGVRCGRYLKTSVPVLVPVRRAGGNLCNLLLVIAHSIWRWLWSIPWPLKTCVGVSRALCCTYDDVPRGDSALDLMALFLSSAEKHTIFFDHECEITAADRGGLWALRSYQSTISTYQQHSNTLDSHGDQQNSFPCRNVHVHCPFQGLDLPFRLESQPKVEL